MSNYQVYACFLSASSDLLEDSILNKLAAQTAPATTEASALGPKVHVELLFVPQSPPVPTLRLGHKVYEDRSHLTAVGCGAGRASRFAGGETSAEAVPEGSLKGTACSIHYGGRAFVRENKTFSRANWEFRRIPATPEQAQAALDFFKQHEGESFNTLGFFSEPIRRGLRKYVSCVPHFFAPTSMLYPQQKWFCSELCEAGLRESGILRDLTPSAHPEQLFQQLKRVSSVAAPVEGRGGDKMAF